MLAFIFAHAAFFAVAALIIAILVLGFVAMTSANTQTPEPKDQTQADYDYLVGKDR